MKTTPVFLAYAMDDSGISLPGHAFAQGIWPLDARNEVAEWQTLSVPIVDSSPLPAINGREAGTTMLKTIAASTLIACHLMQAI